MFNLCQNTLCLSNDDNKKNHCAVFELYAPKAVIKGVLAGLTVTAYCYGNLLCCQDDNMFTNDWAVY